MKISTLKRVRLSPSLQVTVSPAWPRRGGGAAEWQQLQPVELQDRSAMENVRLTCCLLAAGQTKLVSHHGAEASQESLILTRWEKVSNLKIVALLQPSKKPQHFSHSGRVFAADAAERSALPSQTSGEQRSRSREAVMENDSSLDIDMTSVYIQSDSISWEPPPLFCIEDNCPSLMKS